MYSGKSKLNTGGCDPLKIQFDIIKQHGSYMVRRVDGEYCQHTHLSSKKGCKLLISFIHRNTLPSSRYLQISCQRLLTEDEYKRLRKKQRYYNVNHGIKKGAR